MYESSNTKVKNKSKLIIVNNININNTFSTGYKNRKNNNFEVKEKIVEKDQYWSVLVMYVMAAII